MPTLTIDKRFRGPNTSGNGGYVCGRLAAFVDGPAQVRLFAPPPLDTPLHVRKEGLKALLVQENDTGDVILGEAVPKDVQAHVPALLNDTQIDQCRQIYLAQKDNHPLPHCFVCGPQRSPDDGLCLFTGKIPDVHQVADRWVPQEDLAADDGLVGEEFLWAALDCPSYFATGLHGQMALLAQLTAVVHQRPKPGEPLVVMAWPNKSDGRKHFSHSAVVNDKGDAIAIADALWIEVKNPDLLEKLKSENG